MHSPEFLFIGNLFSTDMLFIMFVALMLFGGDKLPEIARGLGKGIRDFKDASEGIKREINEQINTFEVKEEKKSTETKSLNQSNQPSFSPVTNTIPIAENSSSENEGATTESTTDTPNNPVAEGNAGGTHTHHTETVIEEPIKNS